MAHDSVSALEKQMWQLWGTDTERAAKLPIPEGACVHQESELTEHDGSIVAATSILGLQSQLDGAKAELRDFRYIKKFDKLFQHSI